jgi:fermentation-respiration switch protein FrsA (DUF1100 family)
VEHTFSFVDLAGFSALTQTHGDKTGADLVERFTAIVDGALESDAERGATVGDAVFLVSDGPRPALQAVERVSRRADTERDFPALLACALRLPERVRRVTLVSSVALFWPDALRGMLATTRLGFQLAHLAPWLLLVARRMARDPQLLTARLRRELPDPDRRILARPEVARIVAENAAEALATDEHAREMVLLRRDWGFALADICVPAVLWHGEADRNVPAAHGRRLVAGLPGCRATFVPDAGHYLIFDRWADVLSSAAA